MSDSAGRVPGRATGPLAGGSDGVAMAELLVALLVFSIGMLGLLSAQLAGKQAAYDALQRSVASALAGDLLERVRANPAHVPGYAAAIVGDGGEPAAPAVDCDQATCTGAQLAVFDLWQWRRLLLGAQVTDSGAGVPAVGTLRSPRACIATTGERVEVVITWLALSGTGVAPSPACGTGSEPRHQLRLETFVGHS